MRGIVAYDIVIRIRFCRTKLSLLYFVKSSVLTNLHILVTIFENLLAETQTQGRVNSVFPATYMMQIELRKLLHSSWRKKGKEKRIIYVLRI